MTAIIRVVIPSLGYKVFQIDAIEGTCTDKQVQFLFKKYLNPNKETLEHNTGFT